MATASANPQEPVPLDTIPISPEGGNSNGASGDKPIPPADAAPVTVFHDPENFNVKHPLMNTWTLWFTKPPSGKVSEANSFSGGMRH
jgi:translation initiation factor 4E